MKQKARETETSVFVNLKKFIVKTGGTDLNVFFHIIALFLMLILAIFCVYKVINLNI